MRRSASSRPSASSRDRKDSTRLSESIKKSAGPTSPAAPAQHFRTYFIALTTNTYSTMHYDVPGPHKRHPLHELHAALQDSPRRPPPSGVEQRHHLLVGCREVDRDAVGDGDGEQKAPGSRRMPVHAVDDQPPVAGRWMPTHRGPVHLVRQNHAGEART